MHLLGFMRKVMCWGTFDRLHEGHLEFLKDVKSKGDYVVAVVISDDTVYLNKRKYPTHTQHERAKSLRKTGFVDDVIKASENIDKNFNIIATINPEVFVFGYDQQTPIEEKLRNFLSERNLSTKFVISKEFAEGMHASNLK